MSQSAVADMLAASQVNARFSRIDRIANAHGKVAKNPIWNSDTGRARVLTQFRKSVT